MIDISAYRQKIGTFSQDRRFSNKKVVSNSDYTTKSMKKVQVLVGLLLLAEFSIISVYHSEIGQNMTKCDFIQTKLCSSHQTYNGFSKLRKNEDKVHHKKSSGRIYAGNNNKNTEYTPLDTKQLENIRIMASPIVSQRKNLANILLYIPLCYHHVKKYRMLSPNFLARYRYGNRGNNSKGLINMHLNIRSLGNKVFEIKNLIKEHQPHIFGLSECEIRKVNGLFDEDSLKIPGYNVLFPNSWDSHGFARVLVYVKKSLDYQQIYDLQDDQFQSIWFKGGFKNGKKICFCHCYREHTNSLGNSIKAQRDSLQIFLKQWEAAVDHNAHDEPNEVHIFGDMNLDSLNGRWLRPEYSLYTLSKLVDNACNLNNLTQLVSDVTGPNSAGPVPDICDQSQF